MSPTDYDAYDVEVQREEAARFAISRAEAGDTTYLLRLLNEYGPVPEMLKAWLASLFDPKSDLEFAAKIQRRRRGKPPRVGQGVVLAANYVVSNIDANTKLEALIQEAIEKCGTIREIVEGDEAKVFISAADRRRPEMVKRHRKEFGRDPPAEALEDKDGFYVPRTWLKHRSVSRSSVFAHLKANWPDLFAAKKSASIKKGDG
jgi:hypothetical protein